MTGVTGFIGQKLISELAASGTQVIALMRAPEMGRWQHALPWQAEEDVPDISGYGKIDAVLHLAGKAHAVAESQKEADEYFQVNVEGTRRLLEAARKAGIKRFVLFSSVKAMGEGNISCLDESAPCQPLTPYGRSKLAAETLVLEGGYVPEPVVLRLSMVYGDSDKGNLPRMIRTIAQGRFPPLPDTGNRRSMVHVEDVVQAAMLAAERPEAIGQTYIVTDGVPYSTREIYTWICEGLGRPLPHWNLPMPVLRALVKVGDGIGHLRGRRFVFNSNALDKLVNSACYCSHKIERELGFRPRHHLRESLPGILHYLDRLNA